MQRVVEFFRITYTDEDNNLVFTPSLSQSPITDDFNEEEENDMKNNDDDDKDGDDNEHAIFWLGIC